MYKAENCRSVVLWQEIPDWSKFFRGRGLAKAVELSTYCKCSYCTLGNMREQLANQRYHILKANHKTS